VTARHCASTLAGCQASAKEAVPLIPEEVHLIRGPLLYAASVARNTQLENWLTDVFLGGVDRATMWSWISAAASLMVA
jgi:hypothetical protein